MIKKTLLKIINMLLSYLIIPATICGLLIIVLRFWAITATKKQIYSLENAPQERVAIVFGAGLKRDGTPSTILRDRVDASIDLYKSGKVNKILMSGDNRFIDYDEPSSMKAYAVQAGIPESDIVLDFAGRRTYDTCYRALHIFKIEQALLVTQYFHLPRAVFICNEIGLKASGVIADRREYFSIWKIREVLATAGAFWDIYIEHPLPVMGEPEPIFPEESDNP